MLSQNLANVVIEAIERGFTAKRSGVQTFLTREVGSIGYELVLMRDIDTGDEETIRFKILYYGRPTKQIRYVPVEEAKSLIAKMDMVANLGRDLLRGFSANDGEEAEYRKLLETEFPSRDRLSAA